MRAVRDLAAVTGENTLGLRLTALADELAPTS
jgi:hypothetical protein